MKIILAHTPDADDAFMFYKLVKSKFCGNFYFEHIFKDIESLNVDAFEDKYDVTAISFHAYGYVSDKYFLSSAGSSFGLKRGPVIVSKERFKDIKGLKVAVPGKYTSSRVLLKFYEKNVKEIFIPFDKVFEYIIKDIVDAGVVIHEGMLTYSRYKLKKLLDLGEFWYEQFKLPTPLGGVAISRRYGTIIASKLKKCIYDSISYSMKNFNEAFNYAIKFSREQNEKIVKDFIKMFVNELTLDVGDLGRKSIKKLLEISKELGFIKNINLEVI